VVITAVSYNTQLEHPSTQHCRIQDCSDDFGRTGPNRFRGTAFPQYFAGHSLNGIAKQGKLKERQVRIRAVTHFSA